MESTKMTVKVNLNIEVTQEDFNQLVAVKQLLEKIPYPDEIVPATSLPDIDNFYGTLTIFYQKLKKYFDE